MTKPELSIIIPTLNEADVLPLLLGDLTRQRGLQFEVIVADGGSDDETCRIVTNYFALGQLSGTCQVGLKGRGRQLNAGVSLARSEWLLLLHADSRLTDTCQLRKALDFMHLQQKAACTDSLAGHFILRFAPIESDCELGLFFYETKARLGRPGCIHGDQGMLLPKAFFYKLGRFREDLPVMEDTSLAEKIRDSGQWLLLPGEIVTSPRRFQIEGLKARQTLNALMMNFLTVGWLDFFVRAPDIYRQQDRTASLQLAPFYCLIDELLLKLSSRERWQLWLATGEYVRSQVWQIGLFLDCRKAFKRGLGKVDLPGSYLKWFDRWFEPLTDHFLGRVLTALLVRVWFARQPRGMIRNKHQFGCSGQ